MITPGLHAPGVLLHDEIVAEAERNVLAAETALLTPEHASSCLMRYGVTPEYVDAAKRHLEHARDAALMAEATVARARMRINPREQA